ncbi:MULTISPECIES: FecR family protein [Pseudomonas]|uniref:Iron dicitrate transporter FecR n=1 Tax=Pseudomonas chlororaphis TaxID=587753 RepID=A0A0D5Y4C9_9PSED|nr:MULTISPECIES: FecR domain-containing protein [Pseudomonas]AJO77040.1 iron dicitrate transport regulator FecR [Pseudomonas sp. MRSN 12121]AKA26168.1 iron dicitrate transporter FecR [Pseudomonas chlororaphis]
MTRHSDTDRPGDSLDAQAAQWFTRNRDDRSQANREAFQAWSSEPAHARAYAEFERLWADLAELQTLDRPTPLPQRKQSRWRPALAVAAALVCALLAIELGAPPALHWQTIAAQEQGMRRFDLPDGSTLYVNANTDLRIDFSAHQRNLYLDRGQLYLEVAADKERPLWVHAGAASVRVVGTGFDVRRGQKQLVVSVAHGRVSFTPDGQKADSLLLGARQQGIYDYASGTLREQALNVAEVADWRSGHLAFRNRDLASLVDELNLYRRQPVLLADGALGSFKVSGNLDVQDPDALIKALPALIPVQTVPLADGRVRIEARR